MVNNSTLTAAWAIARTAALSMASMASGRSLTRTGGALGAGICSMMSPVENTLFFNWAGQKYETVRANKGGDDRMAKSGNGLLLTYWSADTGWRQGGTHRVHPY
jgi:hypothetical protein